MSYKPAYNILYLVFMVVVIVGVVVAVPIETRPMPYVQDMFDTIDAIPEDSYVWWDVTGWPYSYYTALYSSVPVIRHIIAKELKLVGWGGLGPMVTMHDKIMAKGYDVTAVNEWPKYGTYLVDLGIPPGLGVGGRLGITPLMQLASKWTNLITIDMWGTPLDEIPLTQEFSAGTQASIVFTTAVGSYMTFMPAEVKYVAVTSSSTGVVYGTNELWVSGMLEGFVAGIKQGGQYENLVAQKYGRDAVSGDSSNLLLAETLVGAFIIGGMIVGNVAYVFNRFARGKTPAQVIGEGDKR